MHRIRRSVAQANMNAQHVPWWQAYGIGALGVGLLIAQTALPVSPTGHKLIGVAIVIGMFGMLTTWNRRHTAALDEEALQRSVKRQAAARRVSLSPIQTHYLVAQARRAQIDNAHVVNGSLSYDHFTEGS